MKKILLKNLQLQAQMRILHWQTFSLGEHLAFGDFYDSVNTTIDTLMEAIQGKYGRIYLGGIDSIQVSDYNNLKLNVFLMDMESFYSSEIYTHGINPSVDSEIENIIQEIRASLDKLKYLMTLK
jgi:hypothetical protein